MALHGAEELLFRVSAALRPNRRRNRCASERVRRLAKGSRPRGHHPREGMARPAQVELSDPGLPGVALQILYERP